MIGAICAAPAVVLGKTGLLDGKRVTGYPGTEDSCPGLVFENESFIVDGSLVTGQGPGAAMPFSLALIGVLFDQKNSRNNSRTTAVQGVKKSVGAIGFDNEKYLEEQRHYILERVKQSDGKLYLECGGKLLFDYHASRCFPDSTQM